MDTSKLNEEAAQYINSLSPEDRDALYRQIQDRDKRALAETLDSLTAKLSELNKQPFQHREEKRKIMAEMDKKLKWEAEKQLSIFINDQIEQSGGTINTKAIEAKAKALGLETYGDVTEQINEVMELRRAFRRGK